MSSPKTVYAWLFSNYRFFFKKSLIWLFILGLTIRLLFMPITAMTDLTHNYKGYFVEKTFYPDRYDFYLYPLHIPLEYGLSVAYSTIIPASEWYDRDTLGQTYNHQKWEKEVFLHATYAIYTAFLVAPHVFLKLFLLKLPYLVFDIMVLFLLPLFFNNDNEKSKVFLIWLFNPVSITVSFIFGNPDIIAVFFFMLAIYLIYRTRIALASISMMIAAMTREYFVLVMPLLILYLIKKEVNGTWEKIYKTGSLVFAGLAPVALFFILYKHGILTTIDTYIPYNYLFSGIDFGERTIYLFVVAYAILLIKYYFQMDESAESLVKSTAVMFFLFFGLCFFHPQWLIVATALLCLYMVKDKMFLNLFIIVCLLFFGLLLWWGNHLTIHLFAPLNPGLLSSAEIGEVIGSIFPYKALTNFIWSAFSATSLFIAYRLFAKNEKHIN